MRLKFIEINLLTVRRYHLTEVVLRNESRRCALSIRIELNPQFSRGSQVGGRDVRTTKVAKEAAFCVTFVHLHFVNKYEKREWLSREKD